MSNKSKQRQANRRLLTIISKIQSLVEMRHNDGIDIPHGIDNAIQQWYEWYSAQETK